MSKQQLQSGVPCRKATRRGGGALQDTRELATTLGESERTIRTWRQAGVIPSIVCGYRTYRFKLQDVLAALEKRTI
jgi:excisionase family DNA binding protein